MNQMIMLILDNVDHAGAVFDAWESAGVTGITILESTGLGRMRTILGLHDEATVTPSMRSLLHSREERHRTFIAVVDGDEKVDHVIAATQAITGDLEKPHTGVIFVLPVLRTVGLKQQESAE
jgi:nitrogen regulatory protein PII